MTTVLPAPICLFVFNRLEHTQRTIEHLVKNELASQSDLIVFSDGARNPDEESRVQQIRSYAEKIQGFKSVRLVAREKNWGLAASIIDGVTAVVKKYGRVIVLEDDMITSPYFLKYMNDGLTVYNSNSKVASIHGYVYPIEGLPSTYFLKGADCWGWATWMDRWAKFNPDGGFLLQSLKSQGLTSKFDFNGSYPYTRMLKNQIAGKNNSWAIRWYASAFLADMYTLYPGKSLVANIGNDSSGTHCLTTDQFDVLLSSTPIAVNPISIVADEDARQKFILYFRKIYKSRWRRVFQGLLKLVGA